ncbi:MAG: Amidophosphoribosyltransferase [Anaerolineales bacterium]|nr:Amidophosphoribosyltransferase [Anaerolineales bacterium]
MCGIFGVIAGSNIKLSASDAKTAMDKLFLLSESRGKEAAGIAYLHPEHIYVAKYAEAASSMIKRKTYRNIFSQNHSAQGIHESVVKGYPICIMGHSRLVTNGGRQFHVNNQPVIAGGMVAIHNGIICNVDELWMRNPQLDRSTQVDTEAFLALFRNNFTRTGSLTKALQATFADVEGVASMVIFFEDLNSVLLTTNNGSLYIGTNAKNDTYVFASEKYILSTFVGSHDIHPAMQNLSIRHVEPGMGILIHLDTLALNEFRFDVEYPKEISLTLAKSPRNVVDLSLPGSEDTQSLPVAGEGPYVLPAHFVDEFPKNKKAIDSLRRCTRCILPETMPFIQFDDEGVCNYCRNYQPISSLGVDTLKEKLESQRKNNGEPDCLVAFSGGRDSSYGVHILKTVLGMNPITYTYDWGMITDLGRRNQMRICGKLGIENILVSADIVRKRKNIRKNVLAWLETPDLGTVPLFMAGDKQYFYYANKVGQQTGNKIIILCENLFETTRFKSGFCGIEPNFDGEHTYTLSLRNKFKLAAYYANQYLRNPAYINSSLLDTLGAYVSYYFIPHNYLNIYEYIKWDEQEVDRTLIDEYNWETASDTKSTWRIGDGTASFYNYIYYTMAGFTENDTFRSNQIREGMMTREDALARLALENQPRYDSIQWYCDIIGIDFETAMKKINLAPKLYKANA